MTYCLNFMSNTDFQRRVLQYALVFLKANLDEDDLANVLNMPSEVAEATIEELQEFFGFET